MCTIKIKIIAASLLFSAAATLSFAHCQIPCGIYGDDTRFELMREHVTTIEKSMKEIARIEKAGTLESNQLVRWVSNKESHADQLAEIVTFYFMAQRVKPVAEAKKADHEHYEKKLTLLHQLLVASMKAKQTVNLEHCAQMRCKRPSRHPTAVSRAAFHAAGVKFLAVWLVMCGS
jgi:nickel superoxide dismutase